MNKQSSGRYKIGHKHSIETRLKMSFSHIGMSPGNKKLDVFIKCLSCNNTKKIKPCLEDKQKFCSKKCFDIFKDKGKTSENKKIRESLPYKKWRLSVFERDGYKCIECGDSNYEGRGKTLELNADHILPFALYPEFRFDINNGRTLCKECHMKTETFGRCAIYKSCVGYV